MPARKKTLKNLRISESKNSGESEKKILLAAMQEFVEKGKAGARMQVIADEAGLNKAMLHYYYGGKDKLYTACFRSAVQKFRSAMEGAVDEGSDLESTLDLVIQTFFNFHRSNPGFTPFILREIIDGASELKLLQDKGKVAGSGIEGLTSFQKKVQTLQEQGVVRNDIEPLHIMMTVIGSLASSMLQAHTYTSLSGGDFNELLNTRRDVLRTILHDGLKPKEA